MPGVFAWWQKRSRPAKRRLVFYPGLVALGGGFLAFTMVMPGRSHQGALPPLGPEGEADASRLRADVTRLVGDDVERSQRSNGTLERSAALLESALREDGLAVQRLPYASDAVTVTNLEATLDGGTKAQEIVVVGAHYDTAAGAPGADDNASGVAALLAIARALGLAKHRPARTVRFVAFVNEEPPYFWNAQMGSLVYAQPRDARLLPRRRGHAKVSTRGELVLPRPRRLRGVRRESRLA